MKFSVQRPQARLRSQFVHALSTQRCNCAFLSCHCISSATPGPMAMPT